MFFPWLRIRYLYYCLQNEYNRQTISTVKKIFNSWLLWWRITVLLDQKTDDVKSDTSFWNMDIAEHVIIDEMLKNIKCQSVSV